MRDYYIKLERMILIVENIKKFIYEKLMEMGFLPEEFKNLDEKIYNMKMSSLEVTDLILTIQETYGIVIQTSDIQQMSLNELMTKIYKEKYQIE